MSAAGDSTGGSTGDGAPTRPRAALRELAGLFLRLGVVAFGGPAAHVAMMEDEVVRRRGWMTRQEFLDLYGATNLIPGPNSTELAIHIGHRRAGWAGLLVAGGCFILPAALITLGLAWAYVRFGALPATAGLLYGVKPVIIAVVAQALWGLGRTALRTTPLLGLGAACIAARLLGVHELAILAIAGAIVAAARIASSGSRADSPPPARRSVLPFAGVGAAAGLSAAPFGLWPLFLFFLKVGSVLFGSGYVLLAFLRADLVERYRWLTEAQLLDAIAAGQVTPGPVFTAATFVGYLLGGARGAAVATAGIFLPAFVFVALSGPLVPRIRRSVAAGAFLDGVNVASFALMAQVAWELGRAAIVDWLSAALAAISAVLLIRLRVSSIWLVLGGAALGLASAALR